MRKQTQEGFKNVQSLGEIAVSPDGRFIVFVGHWLDKKRDQECNALFLLALNPQGQALDEPRVLLSSLQQISSPVWAPDSQRILFLSDLDDQHQQIWLTSIEGEEAQKLTTMASGVDEIAWSPNGRWLAFTALAAPLAQNGDMEAREASSRGDGRFEQFTQLFVMSAPGAIDASSAGALQRLTYDAVDYTQPSWTPDSQEIGILRNEAEDRERSFLTDLWAIAPTTGEARCLTNRMLEIDCYAWAPDGRAVIVVASQEESSSNSTQHLYLVTRHGNVGDNTLLLTPELDNATLPQAFSSLGTPGPYRPVWSQDGQKIYFLVTEQQAVNVYCVEVVWRTLSRLTEHTLSYFLALLPDARSLLVAQQYPGQTWNLYRLTYNGSI
ncbi:MAG TPA: S9 family peptidase, partial [Ktedonobacteraceae bacterium]